MPKKSFKNQVHGADKFFSNNDAPPDDASDVPDAQATPDVQDVHATSDTHATPSVQDAQGVQPTPSAQDTPDAHTPPATATERINIRVDPDTKKYIQIRARDMRTTITEYICALIQADRESKQHNSAPDALPAPPATLPQPAGRVERINMRVDASMKQYLQDRAWELRMSVTEYICALIQADRAQSFKFT